MLLKDKDLKNVNNAKRSDRKYAGSLLAVKVTAFEGRLLGDVIHALSWVSGPMSDAPVLAFRSAVLIASLGPGCCLW